MTRARNVSNPQAIDIPLTVSANLTANAVITVGNSSVNSVISSNTYSIGSNVSLNTSRLFLGNSTVNSVHTASTLDVGANVNLSTVGLNVGSNTVNAYINSTSFAIGNSTVNTAITSTTITTPSANINSSVAEFVQAAGTETFKISRTNFNNGQNISLYTRSSGNFLTFSSNLNNAKQAVIENYITGNTTAESSISLRIDGTDKLKANSTLVYISTDLTTTGTANVSTAINVGANVNLGTTYMDVGNSTVNTTITNITVSTNTVNVASIINVGANVNLSTSQINVGNSTVNTVISAASLTTTSNTVSIGTAAYFVANGNVGVGTSSPAYRLDVNGDLKVVNAVRYFVGATQYGVTFANAGAVGTEAYQGTYIYWGTGASTSATERMRLDASGNLGIGTTAPARILEVSTSVPAIALRASGQAVGQKYWEFSVSGTLLRGAVQNDANTTEAFWMEVQRGAGNAVTSVAFPISNLGVGVTSPARRLESRSTGGLQLRAAYDAANYIDIGHMSATTGGVINSVGDATVNRFLSIQLDGVQQMRILSTGYVGINTSTPGTNGAFEIRKAVTTGAMTNCSFSTSDAASSTFDIGHPAANIVALSAQGSTIAFYGGGNVGNAERMRLDRTTGQLLINDTTDAAGGGARLHITGNGSQVAASIKIGTNGYPGWYFVNSSGTKVGDIVINSASTTYNTTSDYRLKENVAPMTGALAKVAQLKPVTYKWKVDGSSSQGFIAHELQAVVPDCVTGTKDALKEDGNPEYQGVDTSFLVATLTAAIQEQQALITQLQADVAELKSR